MNEPKSEQVNFKITASLKRRLQDGKDIYQSMREGAKGLIRTPLNELLERAIIAELDRMDRKHRRKNK